MQSSYINSNQNSNSVNGQGQSDRGAKPPIDVRRLQFDLNYLMNRVAELRQDRENFEAENYKDGNTQVKNYFDEANNARIGYYEQRIGNILSTLGSSTSSTTSFGGLTDNNALGSESLSGVNGSSSNNTPLGNSLFSPFNGFSNFINGGFNLASNMFNNGSNMANSFINNGLGLANNFLNNAMTAVPNAVKGGFQNFGSMLGGATSWFVSQVKGIFNTNEDTADNSNCILAAAATLGRFYQKLGGTAADADQQMEDLRGLGGLTSNEMEGATLGDAGKIMTQLGLKAEYNEETTFEDLIEGLNQGKKFILGVNPAKYVADAADGGHAVVLMGIEGGMAILADPAEQSTPLIRVPLSALQLAMGDVGNETLAVSA